MKIEETLEELVLYLDTTRRVGHTTAIMRGAIDVPETRIVVANLADGRHMEKNLMRAQVIPLDNLFALRGLRAPLVLDNAALLRLMRESLREIERLKIKAGERQP